jgi:hypothetical protein
MDCSTAGMAEIAEPASVSKPALPRRSFYQRVLRSLMRHDVSCLIGGTYALEAYTGIRRATKDLDLFILREDWPRIGDALRADGIETELTFPHWLGKARRGRHYTDLLFGSGNGLCGVDRDWFAHGRQTRIWRLDVQLCPPEELIWSKSFVQERERFDGADVLHLLRAQADLLEWDRLLDRFGSHFEVLLSHLILFGFVYPDQRRRIPSRMLEELFARYHAPRPPVPPDLCRGTLLSREQYLVDVEEAGDRDARLQPHGALTPDQLIEWTAEIPQTRRATLTKSRLLSRPGGD